MVKGFALGVFCCIVLFGCTGFSVKYFGLDSVDYSRGKLLGPEPKDDMPFYACAPTDARHKCVVMFSNDFFKFKQEFIDMQNKLKECEANNRTGD